VRIEVQISPRPIEADPALPPELAGQMGARAEFTGLVRREEQGRAVAALEYEAYLPMAENVMRSILEQLGNRHPCLYVRVTHRVGLVGVGEPAVHVLAAARHRAPALALVAEFIDRLKQDVPIWKRRALTAAELAIRKPV
jgi:molybdopterin synthase catalytic subunit